MTEPLALSAHQSTPKGTYMADLPWRKSCFSEPSQGCLELARDGDRMLLRDSKHGGRGPTLAFNRTEWLAFLAGVQAGEFPWDLPD